MSMRLADSKLIREVLESIQQKDIELIARNIPSQYIDKLFVSIAKFLETTKHVQFYSIWLKWLVFNHGAHIKSIKNLPAVLAVTKAASIKDNELSKNVYHNIYFAEYIKKLEKAKQKKSAVTELKRRRDEEDDSDMEDLMEIDELK